jgi:hypothetical protein
LLKLEDGIVERRATVQTLQRRLGTKLLVTVTAALLQRRFAARTMQDVRLRNCGSDRAAG